ncbi:MAG: DEAD/DEAH box helicase [Thaumarchaeota archaeon]|nr:DEAD/DEAH box helicase [Nitrososphaerota archaeon]
MNSFKELELRPQILRGVEEAGFEKPFPIQERAIGPLLAGRDIIGQAKTGSGKTAAFGLPMLQAIDPSRNEVQALVLAPTRELAVQIRDEVSRLGTYTGIRVLAVYGGQSINTQLDHLRRGVHVVVGTPGRVIDHIKRGTLDLRRATYVVLDEADTMLDMGFIDDIEFILDSIPQNKQMSLFSATMPQRIMDIAQRHMKNPEKILVSADEPSSEELEQFYAVTGYEDKQQTLIDILETERPASAIIFTRTKYGAHKLARELTKRYFNAVPLHGDLSQNQRDHSMRLFREAKADILVATDVASRGLDISQVDAVINFDVPSDPLLYFHRVGRTARAGDTGKAYTLVSGDEQTDFERILSLSKAPIHPLRKQDAEHNFYVTSKTTITELQESRYGGGGGRRGRGGYTSGGGGGGGRYRGGGSGNGGYNHGNGGGRRGGGRRY